MVELQPLLLLQCTEHYLIEVVKPRLNVLTLELPGARISEMVQEDPRLLFEDLESSEYMQDSIIGKVCRSSCRTLLGLLLVAMHHSACDMECILCASMHRPSFANVYLQNILHERPSTIGMHGALLHIMYDTTMYSSTCRTSCMVSAVRISKRRVIVCMQVVCAAHVLALARSSAYSTSTRFRCLHASLASCLV